MAARWSSYEHNILLNMLEDGVSIQSLCDALPNKTEDAIVTRARNKKLGLDFRTSRRDGKLYKGVNRRIHIPQENQSIENIASMPRIVPPVQVLTTSSECLDNKFDVIVAEVASNPMDGLEANQLAITMLRVAKLPIEPTIVCILSEYILVHKDQICVN